MRKLLSLLMALCLLAAPCALAQEDVHVDEDGALIENPIHDLASLDELEAAVPGVAMPALPADANTILYSYIHSDPLIAQIQFQWGEDFYTLRGAALPEGGGTRDIDGLYLPFDEIEEFSNLFEGDEDYLVVKSSTEEEYAVCDWSRHDLGAQYSLFSETAGEPEMFIIELAAELMWHETDWTTSNE